MVVSLEHQTWKNVNDISHTFFVCPPHISSACFLLSLIFNLKAVFLEGPPTIIARHLSFSAAAEPGLLAAPPCFKRIEVET